MIFEQFYLGCLAHASYLIGSEGVAAVIDPQRDVEIYLEAAKQRGLRISTIIETHLHADFVSGHLELAAKTGAVIYLGEGSGAEFPHQNLVDGQEIAFGLCRLKVLRTPGHTIESISIVVTDLERGDVPYAVLTGDTLFIGDVGRPDLSEDYSPQELAGMLYDSLHNKLMALPDDVLVYPSHGAGSMCGRNISADRSSTIARERQTNYALRPMAREQFVTLATADLPPRPEYFARDVALNRAGAPSLADLPRVPAVSAEEAERRRSEGAVLLDVRPAADFCAGHVPGSVNIGLAGQFASWAGAVVGLDTDVVVIASDSDSANEARLRLARVGIERVTGTLLLNEWVESGRELHPVIQVTVTELHSLMAGDPELDVLDVRRPGEWESGHIRGAMLTPLDGLKSRVGELDRHRTIAVHCKGGYRSAVAASILQASGFGKVINVIGGFDAWMATGLPVEPPGASAAHT